MVKLDWKLANDGHATLITEEQHLRFIMDETPLPKASSSGAVTNTGVDMLNPTSTVEPRRANVDQIAEPSADQAVDPALGQDHSDSGGAPKDAGNGVEKSNECSQNGGGFVMSFTLPGTLSCTSYL